MTCADYYTEAYRLLVSGLEMSVMETIGPITRKRRILEIVKMTNYDGMGVSARVLLLPISHTDKQLRPILLDCLSSCPTISIKIAVIMKNVFTGRGNKKKMTKLQ